MTRARLSAGKEAATKRSRRWPPVSTFSFMPGLADSDRLRNVGKNAVIVLQQAVQATAECDIQIQVTIGIIVNEGYLSCLSTQRHAGGLTDLGEIELTILEVVAKQAICRFVNTRIADVNVEIAIVVVVAPGNRPGITAIDRQAGTLGHVFKAGW